MGNKRVKYRQLLSPLSALFLGTEKTSLETWQLKPTKLGRRKEEAVPLFPLLLLPPFFFLPSFEKGKTGHPFTTLIFQHVHPIQLNVREKKGGGVWIIPTKKKKKGRGGKGASTSHYLFQSKLKLVR